MTILLLALLIVVAWLGSSLSKRLDASERRIRELERAAEDGRTGAARLSQDTASLKARVTHLEAAVLPRTEGLATERARVPPSAAPDPAAPAGPAVPRTAPPAPQEPSVAARGEELKAPRAAAARPHQPTGAPSAAAAREPRRAAAASDLVDRVQAWLLGGNTVVRAGVVVLFFGVAFFLNHAIEQGWFPVEARLALAAAGGIALAAVGWRFRGAKRDYALVLQGGGIGIVYLTVFAAVNLYDLIATGPGLALMVVLVALSCALAVLQDARALALLATLGGFLAPVLVSSGGSHVGLFAYYAVLDVGILGIAWFKAWRELNLLGFACTFIIGAVWGAESYRPEHFASTEPFLIGFFLLYVAVPVLFAQRQQTAGIPYIDGSLLFGVPLVAFGLQAALVADFEYGLAFSALVAGTFYVTLAAALWRRLPEAARLLVEALLALGVVFGTIAIPMAVDGRLTAAAWALEGAGLVWVGVRQSRLLVRLSGLGLQVAAGLALLASGVDAPAGIAILNPLYVGALLVSLAGFFTAWYLDKDREALSSGDEQASVGLLAWALMWWCGAGVNEIAAHVPQVDHAHAYLLFAAGSAAALTLLRRTLAWRRMGVPVLLLLPAMAFIALSSFDATAHPLARWGALAWSAGLGGHYWMQWRLESEWPERLAGDWHRGILWLAVFVVSWEAAWLVNRVVSGASVWGTVAWVLVPGATIVAMGPLTDRVAWPFKRFAATYHSAIDPLAVAVALWILSTGFAPGNPAPLPYLPLVNPLELAQCIALAVILRWTRGGRAGIPERSLWLVWSGLAFVVLNGIIARATHFYGDVNLDLASLWTSAAYQTAVSIAWTVAALVAMISAAWLRRRAIWFAGAVLLGAVVVKLFLVDLDDVGTVARIVSFVGVGLMMLVVGYISPLPPRSQEQVA